MNVNYRIVTELKEFVQITGSWYGLIACDVETAHNATLLGVSLSPQVCCSSVEAVYVPIVQYDGKAFVPVASQQLVERLKGWLPGQRLVGHNFTYDKRFVDKLCGVASDWMADTRIMYHLSSAPAGPRPYGLKDAQKELLGWGETNEGDLKEAVKNLGGSLDKGDHYLAPLNILGKYAALDAYSTMQVYKQLLPWFEQHDYVPMVRDMMAYNELLESNTRIGIAVDTEGLQKAHNRLMAKKEAALKRFLKQVGTSIQELEEDWKALKVGGLIRASAIELYLDTPARWEKFNLNSDKHKIDLFYGKLNLARTTFAKRSKKAKSTKPQALSVSADDIALLAKGQPWLEAYLTYEKANTLTSNFTKPYIDSCVDSRLHPGFNICGTVSYRLSGFKPYLLNAPFDERAILKNLTCDPGYGGIHADLSAVEPSITAHYSEDPALLKVFRDGLGDIYLDLALELFPNDKELQNGYNPRIPVTGDVKERFAKQRKIAKVVQLAVQYTGTGHTVAKNLSKNGVPTTVPEADVYVRRYWTKFRRVSEFNYQLRELNRTEGFLRNVIGRIIRVPDPDYKDLSNRFIQSSGHDVLVLWVLEIYRLCKVRGVAIRPVLLDCHDSTSNQAPLDQLGALKQAYMDALDNVNRRLDLAVTIKCEIKSFSTLAGLKGDS